MLAAMAIAASSSASIAAAPRSHCHPMRLQASPSEQLVGGSEGDEAEEGEGEVSASQEEYRRDIAARPRVHAATSASTKAMVRIIAAAKRPRALLVPELGKTWVLEADPPGVLGD